MSNSGRLTATRTCPTEHSSDVLSIQPEAVDMISRVDSLDTKYGTPTDADTIFFENTTMAKDHQQVMVR